LYEIVDKAYAKAKIGNSRVIEDLASYIDVNQVSQGSEISQFSPIPDRLMSLDDFDVHAVANLLVMRPDLNTLVEWDYAEHRATERQYIAAAYLLGLLAPRFTYKPDFHPRALDDLMVPAVAEALGRNALVLPPIAITDFEIDNDKLRLNGKHIEKTVGRSWKSAQTVSTSAADRANTRPTKDEATIDPIRELQAVAQILKELTLKLNEAQARLKSIEFAINPQPESTQSRGQRSHIDSADRSTNAPAQTASNMGRAELGSAAKRLPTSE